MLVQMINKAFELAKKMLWLNLIKQGADVIVAWDPVEPKQGVTVRLAATGQHGALMRQKGWRLHKENRKRRKPNIGHRIARVGSAPWVGQCGAANLERVDKAFKVSHTAKESEFSSLGNTKKTKIRIAEK